jgi:hypothetical protein
MIFKRKQSEKTDGDENRTTNPQYVRGGRGEASHGKEAFYVALVYSTSLAIRAEKLCKKANIKVKLIPTPRHLSSDCGIVLRFTEGDKEGIIRLFKEKNLDYEKIVPL